MSTPDYSFETQIKAMSDNWKRNYEEAYGMPYEEILKDKELVAQIDKSLNSLMWEMGTKPSPFDA